MLRNRGYLIEDNEQRNLRKSFALDDERRLTNVHKIVPVRQMRETGWSGKSKVTIYRGVSKGDPNKIIRAGDWVSLKKKWAEQHGGGKVLQRVVNAYDIVWAGTDMNEWFYSPVRGM